MRFYKHLSLFALAGLFLFLGTQAQAAETMTKERVREIIKEYLFEEPEMIMEAVQKHRENQEREQQENAAKNIKKHLSYFQSKDLPSVGSKDADVTVVEFLDYNCGYCKRALPDVQSLIETDKKVRVVFMDMPILGPTSKTAAEWALAAHKQGKFFEFHTALMEHKGSKEAKSLEKLATEHGLDIEQMKKDIKSKELQEMLEKGINVSRDVGVNGTPAFIIQGTLYPGYLGKEGLINAVKQARE